MELGVTTTPSLDNPVLGDLSLTPGGQEVVLTKLDNEVAQRLVVAFQFWRGEWFLELSEGVPYLQEILRKAPPDEVIRSVLTQVILQTEGVSELVSLDYSWDKRTRHLAASFKVRLEDGSTFSTDQYGQLLIGT